MQTSYTRVRGVGGTDEAEVWRRREISDEENHRGVMEVTSVNARYKRNRIYRLRLSAFRTNNFANNFRPMIAWETANARTPYIHAYTRREIGVKRHGICR